MLAHLIVGALAYTISDRCLTIAWPLACGFLWKACLGPATLRLTRRFPGASELISTKPGDFGYVPQPGSPLELRFRAPGALSLFPALANGAFVAWLDTQSAIGALTDVLTFWMVVCAALTLSRIVWWCASGVRPRAIAERTFNHAGHLFVFFASTILTVHALR
jgi:hypothetical protein